MPNSQYHCYLACRPATGAIPYIELLAQFKEAYAIHGRYYLWFGAVTREEYEANPFLRKCAWVSFRFLGYGISWERLFMLPDSAQARRSVSCVRKPWRHLMS